MSHLESRSLSWSIGFGGNGGEFTTAGFDVSESYTTGNTYTCTAAAGQTVCVTALVGYTDYTAQERVSSGECTYVHSDPYVIYAPNKYDQQYYRCHHDSNCHSLDWEKWDHNAKSCRDD